jgi:hypothetical protein
MEYWNISKTLLNLLKTLQIDLYKSRSNLEYTCMQRKYHDLLHVSVDLLHASPNMLLDGRYIACTVKYVACTENTLHAMEIHCKCCH